VDLRLQQQQQRRRQLISLHWLSQKLPRGPVVLPRLLLLWPPLSML
jgi:hypothetical protein